MPLSAFYKAFSFLTMLMLTVFTTKGQQTMNYAFDANIIYRFTQYINWPDSRKPGDFIIGIVGDSPLYQELQEYVKSKTVGSSKIVIKKMSPSADFYDCQILFISEDKSKSLKKIAEITKGIPILIVSEVSGLAENGSCINLIIVNDRPKMEINKKNIADRNLNIASELLSLGTIVK